MPSKGYLLSVRHWIDRLGLNREDAPPIAYGIQPVMIVSNAADLVSPLLAPFAIVGGERTAALVNSTVFAIQSLAPGGTFVDQLTASSNAIEQYEWRLDETPRTLTSVISPLVENMGPDPVRIVARIGDTITAHSPLQPILEARQVQLGGFYIRPGTEFSIRIIVQNQLASFSAIVRDVPTVIPSNA